jgi:geranylgeranyl pyrophosphate synthase
MAEYGRLTGLGFQIVDDALDYRAKADHFGKPVGLDLAEGRITLPFIRARESLRGADLARLLELGALEGPAPAELAEARALVERGRGIESSMAEAAAFANEGAAALAALAPSEERDLLAALAFYAVERDR